MDYLTEIKTLEERDLILNEIEAVKRKDFANVRKSFLDISKTIDLNELSTKLKELEIVKIIIAISPTTGIIDLISKFFEKNLNNKVIFDFDVDKNILGGLQIIYKGKYFDASI